MNAYDSGAMAGLLKDKGYELTEKAEEADFILLNTCSVREHAEQRAYGRIGHLKELKRRKPSLILGVSGCLAQRKGIDLLKTFPYLDLVLGTHNLYRLTSLLEEIEKERRSVVDVSIRPGVPGLKTKPWRESRLSAFVPVMRGCDNFCSYCIVPYVRGRQRSRPGEDIIREIETLAEAGYEEVTLLGQKISAYGKDLEEEIDFADLLEEIQRNSGGIERIRFTTSHPREMSGKLIKTVKNLDKLLKHIHLPLQAGANSVLQRMNRGYTREFYEEVVGLIRQEMPECTLTTDIIVGFPGESEEDFCQTLDLVEKIKFDAFFAFKYSSRPGTRASRFPESALEEVKKERLKRLMDLQKEIARSRREKCCEV
jgi:tRNA-2-methylthio-N6-dimethylallyladenosine synthase